MSWHDRVDRATTAGTRALAHPAALASAIALVIVWAPTLLFLDVNTSQLLINTATTIVTFIMVFVLHNAQTRDSRALHAKLDTIIRATQGASDTLTEIEDAPASTIEHARREAKREGEA